MLSLAEVLSSNYLRLWFPGHRFFSRSFLWVSTDPWMKDDNKDPCGRKTQLTAHSWASETFTHQWCEMDVMMQKSNRRRRRWRMTASTWVPATLVWWESENRSQQGQWTQGNAISTDLGWPLDQNADFKHELRRRGLEPIFKQLNDHIFPLLTRTLSSGRLLISLPASGLCMPTLTQQGKERTPNQTADRTTTLEPSEGCQESH